MTDYENLFLVQVFNKMTFLKVGEKRMEMKFQKGGAIIDG